MSNPERAKAFLASALQKHVAGNWAEAEQIYREILTLEPRHADAIHLLGVIAHQTGKHDIAIEQIRRAIAINPSVAEFHNNLGEAYRALHQFAEAELHYRKALSLNPAYAEPHCNLGAVRIAQGQLGKAVDCFRQALTIKPDYAEAHTDLGSVLQIGGHLDEAVACFRRALSIKPDDTQTHMKLGIVLKSQGRFVEAMAHFHQVTMLKPSVAEAYNWLGTCFAALSDVEQAAECYQKAIEQNPAFALAYKNLGGALKDQSKLEEATAQYRRAVELAPSDGLRILLGTLLPIIPVSKDYLLEARRTYQEQVLRLIQQNLRLSDPFIEVGATNFYLAYQGFNDRELLRSVSRLYEQACPSLSYVAAHCRSTHPIPSGGKIKVGFFSRFLCDHTIGRLMRGIIAQLSRSAFSVTVLVPPQQADHISEFIVRHADDTIVVPSSLEAARKVIAQEQLDILVYPEIGMDPFTYFLAFSRLAPVQCVTWGHPDTTGIPAMDYFISSEFLEPPDAELHYSERLVRLKHLPTYYYKPERPQGLKSRKDFGLEEDRIIYLCPQSLFKFNPDFDALIAGILRAHPEGRVAIIEGQWKHFTELILRRFQKTIPEAMDRIQVVPRQSSQDFISLLSLADVILDPLKWSGGSTTYEAMSFGIPIVTMPSEFMRGRVTYACYKQMGVMDCVAATEQEYVRLAVRLGTDPIYRAAVKAKLLNANPVLYENADAVRDLERFFMDAVRTVRRAEKTPA